MVFHGGGRVGGEFAISQQIWGIGVSGDIILGGRVEGISVRYVRFRGGVDRFFISHVIYFPFLKISQCPVLALVIGNGNQGKCQ